MKIFFDFHGVGVEVCASAPEFASALTDLSSDFAYFACAAPSGNPGIKLRLLPEQRVAHLNIRAPFLFQTRMCRVHGFGRTRVCDYGQGLRVFTKIRAGANPRRIFWVAGNSAASVYEAAYVALLSAVGEALDSRGFHRVHALAFGKSNSTAILPLASGGGKSSIAALMSRDPSYRLHSDEIPLVKNGRIYPFPIRIALFPQVALGLGIETKQLRIFHRRIFPEKLLLPIDLARVAPPEKAGIILFPEGNPPWWYRVQFIWGMVWGLGAPQMAEFMLRAGNFGRLFRIAFSRLYTALCLLRQVKLQPMRITKSPTENMAEIERIVNAEGFIHLGRLKHNMPNLLL